HVSQLLAARDGSFWIGTAKGLASWKEGKLAQYPELAGQHISAILEDREGTVWIGGLGFAPYGRLCAIQGGTVHCYGEDGSLAFGVMGFYEDRNGAVWAGVRGGVWRWKPGPPKFYPVSGAFEGLRTFAESDDGALLIGTRDGIKRLVGGMTEVYPLPGTSHTKVDVNRLFRDRSGGLWIATHNRGLVHVHQGSTDAFAQSDGLSGESVYAIFEDHEGNIWVSTVGGLDRFREFAVPTFSEEQGLSSSTVGAVLAARDGSVWLATSGGLNRWKSGKFTIPQTGGAKHDGKLNGLAPHALFEDAHGRIWISITGGVGYLENQRFILSSLPGANVFSFVNDTAGNLWMNDLERGLLGLSAGGDTKQIPWASLGHKDSADALAADPLRGGLWLGFYQGGIAYFADNHLRASYSAADGLGEGRVNSLRFESDGTLWAATEGGLSRLRDGRIVTLTRKNGLPCDTVHWTVEDNARSFWLYTSCGLVGVARAELDAWLTEPQHRIKVRVFDNFDGVQTRAAVGGIGPLAAMSQDGKLWFVAAEGISIIDPNHLLSNKLPPPVHIEELTADRKTYDVTAANGHVQLPAQLRDLQIDYTALSLVAPEKVLFRYKLEGWDRDWQDAGTRRQALYSNLPPRSYTFRVMASNNSGVWNEAGTSLDFSVAPAYYQTLWFRAACVIAFFGLIAALYRLRLRQMARHFNMRMEERVNERTRVARDLHDTLLQSFQGLLMKFNIATEMLSDDVAEARKLLESTTEEARKAIIEGREAVYGLRASTVVTNELA
ncbi:MAG TPA: two-component regulator propeller domain-containing protein, partial [Terriglobales bacterium]|nr:two-component regulator propeller domain-containing protein [Terriglobales bacterium]